MMDFFNQVVATISQLAVAGAGTAFMVYGRHRCTRGTNKIKKKC